MSLDNLDRSPGQVNQLSDALRDVAFQAQGVSTTLHRAAALIQETIEKASAASDRHAKSLVCATWALVGVTVVLVIVTGVHAWIAWKI